MNISYLIPIIALIASAMAPINDSLPGCRLPDAVEQAISLHTEKINGAEYCQYRKTAKCDLNADAQEDIVVVYNIEGACYDEQNRPGSCGNKHSTFLTVFLKSDRGYRQVTPIEIGGRGWRDISSLALSGKFIQADTLQYNESDAMCCPSKKGSTAFILSANGLKEVGNNLRRSHQK